MGALDAPLRRQGRDVPADRDGGDAPQAPNQLGDRNFLPSLGDQSEDPLTPLCDRLIIFVPWRTVIPASRRTIAQMIAGAT